MRNIITISLFVRAVGGVCCLVLFPMVMLAQATPDTRTHEASVLRYLKEVEWPKAYRDQDTVLLHRILADEFQMIDAAGDVSTKLMEIAYIKKNKPSYTTLRYQITRCDIFENGTAIISGVGTITGKNENGFYETTYHSSNTLIKRRALWQAISSHVSGVKTKTVP
jgi:hypothetical protein